jgi:PAS domain S-box-containing protein
VYYLKLKMLPKDKIDFLELIPDPSCIVDRVGSIQAVSGYWKEVFSNSSDQYTLDTINALVIPEDLDLVLSALESASISKRAFFRARFGDKTKDSLWMAGSLLFEPLKNYFILSVKNVNPEARLHHFYKRVLEEIPLSLFVKDAKNDYRMVFWNRAAENLFGISSEQILGKSDYENFPKEQADFFRQKDMETIERGAVIHIDEEPVNTAKGTKWLQTVKTSFSLSEEPPHILLGVTKDITDFRQSQRALNEERAKLNLITANIADVIWMTDVKKSRMVFASNAYEKVWGRSLESLYQNPLSFVDAIHKEDRKYVVAAIPKQPLGTYNEIFRVVLPNGNVHWIHDRAFPIRNELGEVIQIVGIATDITERKLAESRLIQSAKFASLGEMSGAIAHEINNPLAIIHGNASQLIHLEASKNLDIEKTLAIAKKIVTTSDRIAKIIRGLRAFSRNADNDPLLPSSTQTIVNDSLSFCTERFKSKNINLVVVPYESKIILARATQISQVILNLLNNSFDAIFDSPNPWVKLELVNSKDKVEFVITDSGPGIPSEIAERIMEPFFTSKPVGKGTGLGLSIAKGLIEANGGRLWLDTMAKNTCFRFELPLAQKEMGQERPI